MFWTWGTASCLACYPLRGRLGYTHRMDKLLVLATVLATSLALSLLKKDKQGTFLGIPYNFEWPTPARVRRGLWNPDDPRLLTPHVYGWGYSANLHAIARRLGLV
jgi:hypothetical protein